MDPPPTRAAARPVLPAPTAKRIGGEIPGTTHWMSLGRCGSRRLSANP